ncbi:hypothetical protein GCM10027062_13720 [Nocardioides hungaricus]
MSNGPSAVPAEPGRRELSEILIGRADSNHLVVPDPLVSLVHARVRRGAPGSSATVEDLDSFRGTALNGTPIHAPEPLRPGDVVSVGNHAFQWNGTDLAEAPAATGPSLVAEGLSVTVRNGRRLIDGIGFSVDAGTLTAVIGPSGAGKSTLLGALTGLRPATSGRVRWRGQDLYAGYEQLRFQVGLVPQQDIQHGQLRVRDALMFAAELRLPPDTARAEREERVQQVAAQLQLSERMDNRIGSQLSGGQRKRVSIATELLTAPPLLFLDEPTSGLDPGLDVEIMRQLRRLADGGRTVLVVTHSVLALDVCDRVLILAPGGRIAYFGPPAGVLAHFGCASYPEVFDLLDSPETLSRLAAERAAPVPTSPPPAGETRPPPRPRTPRRVVRSQLSALTRRNLAVIAGDRLLLTMLVALPLVLGVLSRVVPGNAGMSLLQAPPGPGGYLNAEEATKRITLLIIAAALVGTAMTVRELVGERPILRREYAVGLVPDVYLASKIGVLGVASFAQGVVVTGLATVGLPGPDFGGALGLGRVELALVIGWLAFTMAVVGLLVSALLTSSEQTMPALVGIVMVQLVLCGALVQVAGRPVLEQLAWLAPARWAYGATAATEYLQRPLREQGRALDWIALGGGLHWAFAVGVLALIAAGTTALAVLAVRRSARSS